MELSPVESLLLYITCPTESSSPYAWEFVGFCNNDFVALCKAHNEFGNDLQKAWSTDLLRKYPNSRWVTYRGNKLLIRGNPDGTASVVFSANPAFEHLRIIPKTSEEYAKIQEGKDKKKTIDEAKSQKGVDEKAKELSDVRKKNAKLRSEAVQNVKQSFVSTVENILGLGKGSLDYEKEVSTIDALTKDANFSNPNNQKEIIKKTKELSEKDRKKLAVGVEEKAIKKVLLGSLEQLGEDYGRELSDRLSEKTVTGVDAIDSILDSLDLSHEDAMRIAQASKEYKDTIKGIEKEYKVSINKARPLVITSLNGIGITDITEPSNIADSLLRDELSKIENEQRLSRNMAFYDKITERTYDENGTQRKSSRRLALQGAQSTLDSVAFALLGSEGFGSDLLDFLGVKNASLILAQSIDIAKKNDATKQDLEKIVIERSKNVVDSTLGRVGDMMSMIQDYSNLGEEGTIAKASANMARTNMLKDMGRELSMAQGSLESSATILDGLRDFNDLSKNVIVDGGDDFDKLVKKLKKTGIYDKAIIKPSENGFSVEIPYENAPKLLNVNKEGKKRDKFIADLKSGNLTEKGWLPKGQNPVAYDTISEAQYSEISKNGKASGYEEFTNTKGENGYTSKIPEGSKLYRKPFEVKVADAQQEGIKFIESQKRGVLDFGAGLGKTYTYLGLVSQLKETGKLQGSFAVLSPPSRLRAEFFKDKEKFFPNMNVLEMDEVKGKSGSSYGTSQKQLKEIFGEDADVKALRELSTFDLQQKAIERAKGGFFDVVLTGHDSVKEGNTYKIISEAKPAFVGIDEAHEIIQETSDSGAQSKRLKAMKSMADSAEYFVAGTGTTVKNSIAELGTLLHIARPDVVTDPKKFGKKYENINQGTVVFQNGSTNQFRREFDDIMLSRRSEVEGAKLIETKEKVKITPEQRKSYSQTENQYRLDRDNKGKFGVFDKETGKMDFLDADTLKTFDKDSINFSVGGDVPSPKEVAFLKSNGFDGKRIVELGGTGASQRRDYGHERTLHSGDWKTNAKLSKMVENIKNQPDAKHGILYKNKFSKPAVTKAILDNGYTEDQIVFIDGSVVADKRDKAVTDFQQNPNVKVIVFSEAGATGLNLQAMDNLHHLTRLDTYAKQQQANARPYRKGRKADVNAYYYDSDTPLDNRKVESIERKKKISQSVGEYKETDNLQDF